MQFTFDAKQAPILCAHIGACISPLPIGCAEETCHHERAVLAVMCLRV